MVSPLWIDTHAPAVGDLPQPELREHLARLPRGPINLVLYGPAGSGKTAAARAFARAAHDDPENDLIEINVADFFDRTKSEIREDPRFSHFLQGQTAFSKQYRRGTDKPNRYKREWSKREMIGHVLKELAGYRPSTGSYKTILLDNAEAIREDFQQSLRRVMEQYYETTQFVVTTRQPTKLIPAIQSRCFPVPVRAPSNAEVRGVLEGILVAEEVAYDDAGLEFVVSHADGDLRAAILTVQTIAETAGRLEREAAYETIREVGLDDRIKTLVQQAVAGEFQDARSTLDDLLIDEGYTGGEVLESVVRVGRVVDPVDDAGLTRLAGEIDYDLATGANERIHLARLVAELGADR